MYLHLERNVELPGSFTVLQGLPGDGLLNTMDAAPDFGDHTSDLNHAPLQAIIDAWLKARAQTAQQQADEWMQRLQADYEAQERQQQQPRDLSTRRNGAPPTTTIPLQWHVCGNHNNNNHNDLGRFWIDPATAQLRLFSSLPSGGALPTMTQAAALATGTVPPGTLVVARALHTFHFNPQTLRLDEQATCHNCDGRSDYRSYNRWPRLLPEAHWPRAGRLQYLQTDEGRYIVWSVDGYTLLTPGLADSGYFTGMVTQGEVPQWWWWKVTCPAGAYIRSGVELTSSHWGTAPYGTYVLVHKKVVTVHGLARLYVKAPERLKTKQQRQLQLRTSRVPLLDEDCHDESFWTGWSSQHLNPLSGLQGPILQPLALALPLMYQVVLSAGATVRQGLELSAPTTRNQQEGVPAHATVAVLSRAYTDLPVTNCVPRLCLCPQAAYASLRLNRPENQGSRRNQQHPFPAWPESDSRPDASQIFVPTGEADSTFDPERAGWYHWKLHLEWKVEPSLKPSPPPPPPVPQKTATTTSTTPRPKDDDNAKDSQQPRDPQQPLCLCCGAHEPNATLVHGETGHICCCLTCATNRHTNRLGCPICRLPIEQVVLHYYS